MKSTLLVLGLLLGLPMARTALAATIVFHDLADQVTFSTDTPQRVMQRVCGPVGNSETCSSLVLAPSNAQFQSTTIPAIGLFVAEADLVFISDSIDVSASPASTSVGVNFGSDGDQGGPTCVVVGGCQLVENGQVQTAGTITWSAGTVDTIQFQSDIDATTTPEPSSILLLLTGLVLLGASQVLRRG